ncbi:MAG TPA: polymer-forming cytoskeletal protein [Rhabdochlamydiaceae bacterium]|jgi:cytoskeletal protein CcmA (bactofilin family)
MCFYNILLFLFCCALHADEERVEPDMILLPVGAVHNGDYFAWGKSIEISGTVNGDVYAFAGQIIIDGTVNGDILACGGSVDISGKVANNVRVVAGQVLINAQVDANVTAICGNFQLQPSAIIAGSVVIVAGNSDLAAQIGTQATLIGSNVRVSSSIQQSLNAYVGYMRITSRAHIGGNVDYRSNTPICIDPGARIDGQLIHHPSFVHQLVKGTWIQSLLVGSKILALMMNFFYTLVVGIILIKLFPRNLDAALSGLKEKPWKALGFGIVLLVALPLASLILLVTILGIPFAITLIAMNIIGLYTAKIYTILWTSNWAFSRFLKPNRIPLLSAGLIVYFLLTLIPIFGTLLAVAAMLFGLGAGVIAQTKRGVLS